MRSAWEEPFGPVLPIIRVTSKEIIHLAEKEKVSKLVSTDRDRITSPNTNERKLILLGGHDSYLDQRDREIILADKSLHKMVWKTMTNPGVILKDGEIIGIWTSRKQKNKINIQMTLWADITEHEKSQLTSLAEEFAAFQQSALTNVSFLN